MEALKLQASAASIAAAVLPYCCEGVLNLLFLGWLTAPSRMSSLVLPLPAALGEELMSFQLNTAAVCRRQPHGHIDAALVEECCSLSRTCWELHNSTCIRAVLSHCWCLQPWWRR